MTGVSQRGGWRIGLVLVPMILLIAALVVRPAALLWAWLATMALLVALTAVVGRGITGLWRGALVDDRNRLSLSRLQVLVWTVLVGAMDNVLRPILIRRGAGLPLLLVFAGVLGGIIAFGIIGLFIGPVLLAVSYTLLVDWVAEPGPEAMPAVQPARDRGE